MTTMITEVYDAFRAAGTPEAEAKAAAQAVLAVEQAATKSDLKGEIAELETRLVRAMRVQASVIIGALSFVFGGIATLVKVL
jgi:hypothetical protein